VPASHGFAPNADNGAEGISYNEGKLVPAWAAAVKTACCNLQGSQ